MEPKKPMSPILAGLIISIAVILYSVVMTFASSGKNPTAGWVSYVIIIGGIVMFISQYGKAINHQATFGEYFSYGFKATTMIVLLFVVFLMILAFTMPEIKQQVMEATRLEMEKQKNVTEKDINTMVKMADEYFWVILIGTSVFFFVLIGCIGSLIGAAITRKQPKNPFEQTSF